MSAINYRIGTCCQVGYMKNDKFVQHPDTTIGTITQKSMLQICKVDSVDQLTVDIIEQHRTALTDKLMTKLKQNLRALKNQLSFIAGMPDNCKMFRISSGLLPLFDHPNFNTLYNDKVLAFVDTMLAQCKTVIDRYGIRVSCHPDQYTVINSLNPAVRAKSYRSLYMHKYFMERLTTADQTCINVHLNGHLDHLPEIDQGLYLDLLPWISFENEDKKGGKKDGYQFTGSTVNTLQVCERYNIKMVFDMHHHYALEGDQLSINDGIIDRIVATWQGVRPIMHLSQGKETPTTRAHSDMIDDIDLIQYSYNFLYLADIDIEAKHKTVSVLNYAESVKTY